MLCIDIFSENFILKIMETASTNKYIIHTDGGSRGNPGPAAIGCVIEQNGKLVTEISKTIGVTTNNVAEYTAVLTALEWLTKNSKIGATVTFYCDSQLIVEQLSLRYKIKDEKMKNLFGKVKKLEMENRFLVTYVYVPRNQNSHADALVNRALDHI